MIENFLETALLVYLIFIIVIFTLPPLIGLAVNGIEGLKDFVNMLKDKYYYIYVVKPVFILVTFANIIAFLIILIK